MKTTNPASTPIQDPTGQDRKSGTARRRRGSARARSGLLCLLLGGTLTLAAAPQWAHEAWTWLRPGTGSELPLVPADILLRAADAAATRGDVEESLRLLGTFAEQHPEHPGLENALAAMSRQHLQQQEFVEARTAYQQLRMGFPGTPLQRPLLQEIGEHELQHGLYEDAMRSYKDLVGLVVRAAERRPLEDTAPLTAKARKALRRQQQKIENERNEIERLARFNLAVCQEKTQQPAAAIRAYERFVRRFPTDARVAEAQYRMGALHLELGRHQEARQQFEPLCTREDISPVLRAASIYHAGRCSEKLQQNDAARDFYRMAMTLEPRHDDYRLASLGRLARLIEAAEPLRARDVYRDLASHSDNSVRRAIARQRFVALQGEATVAAAATPTAVEGDQ